MSIESEFSPIVKGKQRVVVSRAVAGIIGLMAFVALWLVILEPALDGVRLARGMAAPEKPISVQVATVMTGAIDSWNRTDATAESVETLLCEDGERGFHLEARVSVRCAAEHLQSVEAGDLILLAIDGNDTVVPTNGVYLPAKICSTETWGLEGRAIVALYDHKQTERLSEGQTVRCWTKGEREVDTTYCPRNAIQFESGRAYVMVVRTSKDNEYLVACHRFVELGIHDVQTVEIRSGVQAGEVLAVAPPFELADGSRVRVDQRGLQSIP